MGTFISHSPEETSILGQEWGRCAAAGLVIGVSGDLGAGKTQLAKGVARGLGYAGRVQSPSFALLNTHRGGRLTFYHIDLFRLETRNQLVSAGLEDYLQPDGVTLIEWAERWFGEFSQGRTQLASQPGRLKLVNMVSLTETLRRIDYEDFGT